MTESTKFNERLLNDTINEARSVCNRKGHKWETYTVSTGYWSNDIEQAGYCLRCGEDTHGEYYT